MIDHVKACVLTAYAPNTANGRQIDGSPYKKGQERLVDSLKYWEQIKANYSSWIKEGIDINTLPFPDEVKNQYLQMHLKRSLNHHGFRYDILAYEDFQTTHFNTSCGYNIKADALTAAMQLGYERILWLDSSVWAVRDIGPVFDYIDENGWYFYSNGFNMAQTADDNALSYFNITRDEAEKIPDISSSMFGLHMGNPKAQEFAKRWITTAKKEMWATSREHGGGSQDPRFMCDRQDQSCASLIIHQLGMHMTQRNEFSAIANDTGEYPETVRLVMRGL